MSYLTFCVLICLQTKYSSSQWVANGFTLPPLNNDLIDPAIVQQQQQPNTNVALDAIQQSGYNIVQQNPVGCSDTITQLCNQQAWTDFGLSISGITPKQNLCFKYAPDTSCLSVALATCPTKLNNVTKTMMLAFARIVVSWCYDGGANLKVLDTYNECLSIAMFDAVTTQGCLFDIVAPFSITQTAQKSLAGLELTKMLNNLVGTYQSSTVICMKKSIEDACGKDAAELSLGAALEELVPSATLVTSSVINSDEVLSDERNQTNQRFRDTQLFNSGLILKSCCFGVVFLALCFVVTVLM